MSTKAAEKRGIKRMIDIQEKLKKQFVKDLDKHTEKLVIINEDIDFNKKKIAESDVEIKRLAGKLEALDGEKNGEEAKGGDKAEGDKAESNKKETVGAK